MPEQNKPLRVEESGDCEKRKSGDPRRECHRVLVLYYQNNQVIRSVCRWRFECTKDLGATQGNQKDTALDL